MRTDCIHEYRRRGLICIQPLPNDVRAALLRIARGFVALLLTALIYMPSPLVFGVLMGGLHCTVFWLSTEHDPGLNVTRISELCTMQTFGSETAH